MYFMSAKFYTKNIPGMTQVVAMGNPFQIRQAIIKTIAIFMVYMGFSVFYRKGDQNKSMNVMNVSSTKIHGKVCVSDGFSWSQDAFVNSLRNRIGASSQSGQGLHSAHVTDGVFAFITNNSAPFLTGKFFVGENNWRSHGLPPRAVKVRATPGRQSCRGSLFVQNPAYSTRASSHA